MKFGSWKMAISAIALASLTAMPGFVSSAHAEGGGCCKGKEQAGKAKVGGGCMGGAEKKDGKGGMSCMKGMDMANMSMAQKSSDDAMMSGMDHSKMDMSGGDKASASGNPEVDFAKAMIPHHESAVAMANKLLKIGNDPELKKMAEEIVAAQNKAIKFLYSWLAKNAN
jgi:uncharacterized protein involved in copper resistance